MAATWVFLLSMPGYAKERRDTRSPPEYPRQDWLRDSLRSTDLVVVGTPRRSPPDQAFLEVTRILFAEPHSAAKVSAGVIPILPDRFRFTDPCHGIWILIRTPAGFTSTNPDALPLDERTWPRIKGQIATNIYRDVPGPLREHESKHQLYRTFDQGGTEVSHGINVHLSDRIFTELHARGRLLHTRAWDRAGRLERVAKLPRKGPGFFLQWRDGKLLSFSHFLDGQLTGTERTYYPDSGRLRHEVNYQAGVRHGEEQAWDEQGKRLFHERFEHGFLPPVIAYRGSKKPVASLTKGADSLYYSAPRWLMNIFLSRGVGMTTKEVSTLLQLDFSERSGITFPHYRCDESLDIEFRAGKIAKVSILDNGVHCE